MVNFVPLIPKFIMQKSIRLVSGLYLKLSLLTVAVGLVLRVVLLFNEQTTSLAFSFGEWCEVFLLGAVNDFCAATAGFIFLWLFMLSVSRTKYRKPWGYILLALLVAATALLVCLVLGLSPIACAAVVVLAFVTTIMSAQSVGQTGIDPMEIFGLIVLLVIAALGESDQVRLFFVAGVVAVACGLAGDVMSDFKTGKIIGTDPRAMWIGQAIGALIGCAVSVAVMCALLNAYGADAFGPEKLFVSAQASVVATMVSGIPSVSAFALGLAAGVALYCLGIPSMMLGLGVYLPFYMTLSASLGAAVKIAYDRVAAIRNTRASGNVAANVDTRADETSHEETGIVVASGVLGGESIVGVIIALASVASGLLG